LLQYKDAEIEAGIAVRAIVPFLRHESRAISRQKPIYTADRLKSWHLAAIPPSAPVVEKTTKTCRVADAGHTTVFASKQAPASSGKRLSPRLCCRAAKIRRQVKFFLRR
jgi:hypothetical protein